MSKPFIRGYDLYSTRSMWRCSSASVCACVRGKKWDETDKTINWSWGKKRKSRGKKETRTIILLLVLSTLDDCFVDTYCSHIVLKKYKNVIRMICIRRKQMKNSTRWHIFARIKWIIFARIHLLFEAGAMK